MKCIEMEDKNLYEFYVHLNTYSPWIQKSVILTVVLIGGWVVLLFIVKADSSSGKSSIDSSSSDSDLDSNLTDTSELVQQLPNKTLVK
jgi:hypothetical protein